MLNRVLSYSTYGRKENPAVLFLHGFLGCKEDWHEVASNLSQDRFVIAVDLPGHGESIEALAERDYTMEGCSELLIELLNSLNIDKCSIIGYSMGGRLALYFTGHYPDRVNAVILESSSPGLRTESEREERRAYDATVAERLLSEPIEQFLNDWYAQPLFESLRKINRFDKLLERRRANNPHGLALSLRQMGTGAQPSLWAALPSITLPILLLAGQLDYKFTRISEEMAAACPHCTLRIVEGAGHTLHFETPDRYIAAVRQFLNERK